MFLWRRINNTLKTMAVDQPDKCMTRIHNNWSMVVGGKGSSWLRLAGDTRWPVLAVAARGVGLAALQGSMSELRRRAVIAAVANPLRTEVPALLVRCEQCRHCRVTRNGSPQRSGVSSTPSRNTRPSSTRGTTLTAWGTVRTGHGGV